MSEITRNKAIDLFNGLYGRDLFSRLRKLKEESSELIEAIDGVSVYKKEWELDHLIDEMADVQAVLIHTASILNTTPEDLLKMAIDKVEKRRTNPNYKRS